MKPSISNCNYGSSISQFSKQLVDETMKIAFPFLELVFIPKAIAHQLLLAIVLETGATTVNQILAIFQIFYSKFSTRLRLISQLEKKQQKAKTQDEWMDIAEQIDNIQGNDVWRSDPSCPLYESDRISARADEFIHLMRRRGIFDLMFTLRGGIARNKFGLLNKKLFNKALAGSKVLVETYHNVVCAALDFVCDAPCLDGEDPIPTDARLAFFNEVRHSYGRTALMLSGGAALGFYHVGVVKALMKNGLLPRVISGSSAGSIVSAMVGTRTDEECMKDLFEANGTVAVGHSGKLMLNFFRPVSSVHVSKNTRLLDVEYPFKNGTQNTVVSCTQKQHSIISLKSVRNFTSRLYDIFSGRRRAKDMLLNDTEHFRRCCRVSIGDFTFQEAFDRTGRILNIIVSPQNRSDPPRLLNYLTAPHVLVWSAAVASSSLPGVFQANKLLVKDADGTERYETATASSFIDGSMEADLPMQQLSEMFNVNHFIISQANPHAVMLTSFDLNTSIFSNNRILSLMHGILQFLKKQVKMWIGDVIELIGGQRSAPVWDTRRGFASQILTQEYEGRRDIDISLIPWAGHRNLFSAFLHCIYNPSEEDFREWTQAAERETWRYVPKIKSHVAEEMTLDRCVQRLRKKLLFENAQLGTADFSTEKMTNRVPSFFTSGSLINMSGLCVTDQYVFCNQPLRINSRSCGDMDGTRSRLLHQPFSTQQSVSDQMLTEIPDILNTVGLHGKFTNSGVHRSTSGGSGLFLIDSESEDERSTSSSHVFRSQEPGEVLHVQGPGDDTCGREGDGYIKTTSMSDFYYRRTSHGSLAGSVGKGISNE